MRNVITMSTTGPYPNPDKYIPQLSALFL